MNSVQTVSRNIKFYNSTNFNNEFWQILIFINNKVVFLFWIILPSSERPKLRIHLSIRLVFKHLNNLSISSKVINGKVQGLEITVDYWNALVKTDFRLVYTQGLVCDIRYAVLCHLVLQCKRFCNLLF